MKYDRLTRGSSAHRSGGTQPCRWTNKEMNILNRILERLSGRTSRVNILTPMELSTGMHVVNQDVQLQSRNSPDVPPAVVQDIVAICQNTPEIERCHVLDVLDSQSKHSELKNFIVVSLDNSTSQLEGVALKLQEMLKRHSIYAKTCFIAASDTFPDIFGKPEYALYIRGNKMVQHAPPEGRREARRP